MLIFQSWSQKYASHLLIVTCDVNEDILVKIRESSPDADPSTITLSSQPRGGEYPVSKLKGRNLQSLGLKCVAASRIVANLLTRI